MAVTPLPTNDPIIEVTLEYPDNVHIPSDISHPRVYFATVTIKNKSKLPLAASSVNITLDDSLQGYEVELWDDKNQVPVDLETLPIGALPSGGSKSATFWFRTVQQFPQAIPQANPKMIFHVMPSYKIDYQGLPAFTSKTTISVKEGSGGGVSWKTSPPWNTQAGEDPVLGLVQGYYSGLLSPLAGWNPGDTPTPAYYVACALQATNNGSVPISSLTYLISVDDDLANYNLKCLVTGSWPWGRYAMSAEQGPIDPGKTTGWYSYWVAVFHITGADQGPVGDYSGLLQVAPSYTVQYQNKDSLNKEIPVGV
jgi:hypothetical protein